MQLVKPVDVASEQVVLDDAPVLGTVGGHDGVVVAVHELGPPRGPSGYRPIVFGRENVDNASGPASLVLIEQGRRVGSLGPGLTSDSADAVRAVLRDDLSAGPQVLWHQPAVPA